MAYLTQIWLQVNFLWFNNWKLSTVCVKLTPWTFSALHVYVSINRCWILCKFFLQLIVSFAGSVFLHLYFLQKYEGNFAVSWMVVLELLWIPVTLYYIAKHLMWGHCSGSELFLSLHGDIKNFWKLIRKFWIASTEKKNYTRYFYDMHIQAFFLLHFSNRMTDITSNGLLSTVATISLKLKWT